MIRIFLIGFLTCSIHFAGNSQTLVDLFKSSGILGKKGDACKPKTNYHDKSRPYTRKHSKIKSSLPPYKYVYTSKSAEPPRGSEPTSGNKVTASKSQASNKSLTSEKAAATARPVSEPVSKNIPPPKKSSVLTNMPPEQRKKAVLDMPPSRTLKPISFISDQDEFSVVNMDSFMEALELINQGKMVLIEGHTDDLGKDDYNLNLSMKRVEKIRQLMLQAGADDGLISVIGYGERRPIVPNTNEENRQTNRRIEFKVFDL